MRQLDWRAAVKTDRQRGRHRNRHKLSNPWRTGIQAWVWRMGFHGWRAGGVEWSSQCWRMSHRREAMLLRFPVGWPLPKEGRKNPPHVEEKRGSEGKCG